MHKQHPPTPEEIEAVKEVLNVAISAALFSVCLETGEKYRETQLEVKIRRSMAMIAQDLIEAFIKKRGTND